MNENGSLNKLEAIEYLVKNNVYGNEWQGAGMYEIIAEIITLPKLFYYPRDLNKLLERAKNK